MRKRVSPAYILLFVILLALMSIPRNSAERMRGAAVAAMAPMWHQLLAVKTFIKGQSEEKLSDAGKEEYDRLRLENKLLKDEILRLKDVMQQEMKLLAELKSLGEPVEEARKAIKLRHARDLEQLMQVHLKVMPARVIFRAPSSWNSSFWINVGTSTNDALGVETIAKNSPVLIGTSVIGVIDYVGKKQSRVRLVTDSGMSPAVRAERGDIETLKLKDRIDAIAEAVNGNGRQFSSVKQKEKFIAALSEASSHLTPQQNVTLLAKGELHGTSKPLWRTQRHLLKGTGFNYDFADGEGPARDLLSGQPLDADGEILAEPIVKAGDVLVTTGMDGVFPPGLSVAEVVNVHPLQEGDYYYELDARPMVGNFDDVSLVFVIPPIGYDPEERPSPYGWR